MTRWTTLPSREFRESLRLLGDAPDARAVVDELVDRLGIYGCQGNSEAGVYVIKSHTRRDGNRILPAMRVFYTPVSDYELLLMYAEEYDELSDEVSGRQGH